MNWSFDWICFFGGIAIAVGGILVLKFYRQISHNFANGVSSYDKVKLAGTIITIFGFILMANLHTLLLGLLLHIIMPNQN